MVRYDKVIINKLLDSYESSLLYTGENERTINISVRFTKAFIPEYYDESSEVFQLIEAQMRQLEDEGIISIIWKDNKKDHIISKVSLNIENIDNAYKYVKRIQKAELICRNIEMLTKYRKHAASDASEVCLKFIDYLSDRLKNNKTVKEFIKIDNLEESLELLSMVHAVEHNKDALYVREFSIKHFKDSKRFEQLVGKIHNIFVRFDISYKSKDMTEWLAEHNIYQTPNFVYLKGNIKIYIEDKVVDLSPFSQGVGISGEDIGKIQISEDENIKKVITIENLTTYFRWQEEDSMIIYLGGYHNSVRRNLLKKIYKAFPDSEYFHFGDIDAGGFEIYKDLCNKTHIPFKTYNMNLKVLTEYKAFGKELTQNDRKRLEMMLLNANSEENDLIEYMLEKNIKLEQECIGI